MPRVPHRSGIQAGPLAGFALLLALLALLDATTGVSVRGWLVGVVCGVGVTVLVSRSMTGRRRVALGPADRVTMARAVLTCGVAALTADAVKGAGSVVALVALAAVALVLDGVDGRVARSTDTASSFGARFDMEVDALLILVLSVCVARDWGWWVLSLGLARYLYLAAGRALPWLRQDPPPRRWAKVVAVFVGMVLTVAAAGVLPGPVTLVLLVAAMVMLVESFARSVWDLWRRHGGGPFPRAAVTAALAMLAIWAALLMPDRLDDVSPGAFLRIPVEGLLLVGLTLVVPPGVGRRLALVGGLALGLLTILRMLDLGFWVAFNGPFHPVYDTAYAGAGLAQLRQSIGSAGADLAVVCSAVLLIALLVLFPLAGIRLARLVTEHRGPAGRVLAGLTAVAILAMVLGPQIGPAASVASTATTRLVYDHATQVRDDLHDQREFTANLHQEDPFDGIPSEQLLTGLHGKEVLLVFVESYGRSALRMPLVAQALGAGDRRLRQAGYASRSGYLTSPTFGGLSWLAHSTLQSGLWVDNQRRYDQLMSQRRLTLTDAFERAGWRTVIDLPAADGGWSEGAQFYHFDQVYDRANVGYAGPGFTWDAMPDQYTLAAFQRLELEPGRSRPVMAQINLVSSHWPWPPQPSLVDWNRIGDGSIYATLPTPGAPSEDTWYDTGPMTAAYAQAIAYSLDAVTSFVQQLRDRNIVLVVLGDHQPSKLVSREDTSHDVPVSIIAADPKVLQTASEWGWQEGLHPGDDAPVWPMDSFRNRFLTAFGTAPSAGPDPDNVLVRADAPTR